MCMLIAMQIPKRKSEEDRLQSVVVDYHVLPETLERYKRQLTTLKARHPEVKVEVRRTAEEGDFSENAGYQAAKRELRSINSRMIILEDKIAQAIVIDEGPQNGTIGIGSTVMLNDGAKKRFRIVGPVDVDLVQGRISYVSPLGVSLMGRHAGDRVNVNSRTWTIEAVD